MAVFNFNSLIHHTGGPFCVRSTDVIGFSKILVLLQLLRYKKKILISSLNDWMIATYGANTEMFVTDKVIITLPSPIEDG